MSSDPVRCEWCRKSLQSGAVMVNDKFFHRQCFRCNGCKQVLSTGYHEASDKAYCQKCFHSMGSICFACKQALSGQMIVRMLGREYHVSCANCPICRIALKGTGPFYFYQFGDEPYCLSCYIVKAEENRKKPGSSATGEKFEEVAI